MEDIKQQVGHRIDLLTRRINELIEQQKATERQIKAYKELIRYYHAVYEAEHGLGTEGQLEPELMEKLERIINDVESTKAKKSIKSVPDAVLEILLEKNEPLHAKEIAKAIVEKYPEIQERVRDIEKRVVVALVRGTQQDMYERVGRNIYKLKTKKK